MNYSQYYQEIIEETGTDSEIILCNDSKQIVQYNPDGVIAADIYTREKTKRSIREEINNCITLDDVYMEGRVCSEWGLLGSNMSMETD
ncbi:MAG: hypothetical protein ACOC87_02495 [Candidatus Natronoplasma sp.]